MTIRNYTGHPVYVFYEEGDVVRIIFHSDGEARARQTDVPVDEILGISVVKTEFGEVVGLPEPRRDVYLIVSFITARAALAHGRTTADLSPSVMVRTGSSGAALLHASDSLGGARTEPAVTREKRIE